MIFTVRSFMAFGATLTLLATMEKLAKTTLIDKNDEYYPEALLGNVVDEHHNLSH